MWRGAGRAARRQLGADVVGLDPTPTQVRVARDRDGGPQYARARAEALPCADDAFDAVLLCLALEHVEAFELAIHEVARVLEPGGRFVLLLAHPLLQAPRSGWVEDQSVGEHSWRIGSYLVDDIAVDTVAPGVELLFVHRPLSRYVHTLGEAGLLIDDMEEPPPPGAACLRMSGTSRRRRRSLGCSWFEPVSSDSRRRAARVRSQPSAIR